MRFINARYNSKYNSIDITKFDNIYLELIALAIDEPLEYARLALDGEMQMWVDAEDSLELW